MGQRLRTHLDLLHPDTSCNVIKKQDKLTAVTKRCRKFSLVDCLYAKNFKGPDKWSSVTVTHITGPVSYQVQNSSGTIQHHHVDHLHYHYPLNSDDQESNNFDDWPFSSTTSTTDVSSNLEQGHGQSILHHPLPPLFNVLIEPAKQLIVMDLTFQTRRGGML